VGSIVKLGGSLMVDEYLYNLHIIINKMRSARDVTIRSKIDIHRVQSVSSLSSLPYTSDPTER
jgi:hypothetical protein